MYFQIPSRLVFLRLSFSECIFGRSSRFHRIRYEILHRSIKKIYQKILIRQKVRATQSRALKIFEIEKKSKMFQNFHWKFNENENFWDQKISKFFDLKNFKNFHWKLYENENFWDRKFSKLFDLKKISRLNVDEF